jgi:uncharacterized membrane protein
MALVIFNKLKSADSTLLMLCLQALLCLFVFFDVPIMRQVFGFLYFLFVPGILILDLLGLRRIGLLLGILYSVGLGICYLIVLGLMLNYFGPLIGVSRPLSLVPMMIVVNVATLFITVSSYLIRGRARGKLPSLNLKLSRSALFSLILPILGVAGAVLVNTSVNNSVSLVMIISVVLWCVASIVTRRPASTFFITVLPMVAVALLLNSTLMSNYIHGPDIHVEYYLFRLTQIGDVWNPQTTFPDMAYSRTNAMLSVTILPTIYSTALNFDATWVYKIIFPLIYAFVPLGIYELGRSYFGEKVGFVAAFLFMSEVTFVLMAALTREIVGELFFILLFLVVFDKALNPNVRLALFAAFSFGVVTSHYAMALVFLFFLVPTWLFVFWRKKRSIIRPEFVLLFFSVMFLWYIYVYWASPFESIVEFAKYIYSGLGEFFNPASRGSEVLRGIGVEQAPTAWQMMSRLFAYSLQLLIGIGILALALGKSRNRKEYEHVDYEYIIVVFLAGALLGMCILIPRFASSLNMERFYHIALIVLAPSLAIGCKALTSLARKHKEKLFASLVLVAIIPYFLFQSGFVYEIVQNQSWTPSISGYRMGIRPYTVDFCYVQEQDVCAAIWLSNNIDKQKTTVYADLPSIYAVLASYGLFNRTVDDKQLVLSNTTVVRPDSSVFLSSINAVNDTVQGRFSFMMNSSILEPIIGDLGQVYTNGCSEIYQNP